MKSFFACHKQFFVVTDLINQLVFAGELLEDVLFLFLDEFLALVA
jgi:hypothetical protein